MWPFKRKESERLSPTELRDRLIAAASSSRRKLRALCFRYRGQVADNLELMRKIPEGLRSDPPAAERYMQCLTTVAHCLATRCNAPELWNKLCGTPDDNPVLQWDRWYGQVPERMERLEYDELITEATEVDPYDPDPPYQSGTCLLELGAYGKAREAFESVEQLAPGWFRCRSDIWLAESLDNGSVSDEEFRLLRVLEDGGLSPSEAMPLARQAVERYPEFAAYRLILGDLQRNDGDSEAAVASYRAGLELAKDPDLESRLLCALVGALPKEAAERPELIGRAVCLKGSLVAQATARLLGVL